MEKFLDIVCTIIVIIILGRVLYGIYMAVKRREKAALDRMEQEQSEREEFYKKIAQIEDWFRSEQKYFYSVLSSFFEENNTGSRHYEEDYSRYQGMYSNLLDRISSMNSINTNLQTALASDSRFSSSSGVHEHSDTIQKCSELAEAFLAYSKKFEQLPTTCMMDPAHYGSIQKSYWDSVRSMDKSTVDTTIEAYHRAISSLNYSKIFEIDIQNVLRCIWFYATEKPYSTADFNKAVGIFEHLKDRDCADVMLAEMYAKKQIAGENALRDSIHGVISKNSNTEVLTLLASAMMWLKAYQAETIILQYMLSEGMQMSAKMLERLHSLTNGGGKAPAGFDVPTNDSAIYFDVSSLAWRDDEYAGLFENLEFQEKSLSYSLAVRDENKELFLTNGIQVPDATAILHQLNTAFAEEYGTAVTAEAKKCIALSGSGEENLDGFLVKSDECSQLGVLVHIARIGKKLNIKFYTLFIPTGANIASQKQQVLSLYKKLSPTVAMWESGMKDTVLMAIQQLLNTAAQTSFVGTAPEQSQNEPIF